MKTMVNLTSAMTDAVILIDVDAIKVIMDVSIDNNKGESKIITPNGNYYVKETYTQVAEQIIEVISENS